MRKSTFRRMAVLILLLTAVAANSHAQGPAIHPLRMPAPAPAPPPAAAAAAAAAPLTLSCPAMSFGRLGVKYDSNSPALTATATGGNGHYTFSATGLPSLPPGLTLAASTGVITGTPTANGTYKMTITAQDTETTPQTSSATCTIVITPSDCWLAPTRPECMGAKTVINDNLNAFFNTNGTLSWANQIKSIYNGASSSATVSADLATLNFTNGMQLIAGTNIQAGSTSPTPVSTGTVPTLSATSAAQATQNMLYGGTIVASGLYPLLAAGADSISSAGGLGLRIDFAVSEGVDIQNFKSGTSTNVNNPTSHSSAQVEGYLQYNSINYVPGAATQFVGAVFVGGSYGYSYTSHDYARDYGFGNVNNGLGQAFAGILINNVAKIAVSRAFGPSQTYIDSTSMAQTTINNFKSWSFGITYQSPPPASK